jgi:hypothetical protein
VLDVRRVEEDEQRAERLARDPGEDEGFAGEDSRGLVATTIRAASSRRRFARP